MHQLYCSIEGVETTGKSSTAIAVQANLARRGITCDIQEEFPRSRIFDAPIKKALQKSAFVSRGFQDGPYSAFFFMLAADCARQNSNRFSARVLLSERGVDSIAVYQGAFLKSLPGRSISTLRLAIRRLYRLIGHPIPDFVFVLHAPLGIIKRRFSVRERRPLSKTEASAINKFQKLFVSFAQSDKRYVLVDAQDPIPVVADLISDHIVRMLKRR